MKAICPDCRKPVDVRGMANHRRFAHKKQPHPARQAVQPAFSAAYLKGYRDGLLDKQAA